MTETRDLAHDLARHLYQVGRALYLAANMGTPPPGLAAIRDRMATPRPGDIVIEISSLTRAFEPDSIGRLVEIEGNPSAPDRCVIEPLLRPGEQQGWQNSIFVALPDQPSVIKWAD